MTHWTVDDEAYLVSHLKVGVPVQDIAKALKKTPCAVYHKKFNLGFADGRRPHPVFSDEKVIERLLQLYDEGYTLRQMGKEVGISYDLVRRVMARKGVKTRKKFSLKTARTYAPELIEKVRYLFLVEKKTQKEIGTLLGMRSTTVRDLCISRGFRRNSDWTEHQRDTMSEMLLAGRSVEDVSATIGKSLSAIVNKGFANETLKHLPQLNITNNRVTGRSRSLKVVLKARLKSATNSPQTRGLACNIDLDYLKSVLVYQDGLCFYTGEPLNTIAQHPYCLSLDRHDSSQGYIRGNVVLCGWIVNKMKQNVPFEQFIEVCGRLHAKWATLKATLPAATLKPDPQCRRFDFSRPMLESPLSIATMATGL